MSISTPRAKNARRSAAEENAGPRAEAPALPPLENGDRLDADEFLRRYEAMPDVKKAELIQGVVYVPSPVRHIQHGDPHSTLNGWLFTYRAQTRGIGAGDNSTVRLDLDNVPQPDCLMFIEPDRGGRVRFDEDGYILGAPDLLAEIAASSASYDLHDKLETYRKHGVREYLVWRVLDRELDWFVLRGDRFEPLAPAEDGTLRSTVFPGLWLDAAALLRGDLAAVLAALQRGLAAPEHAAFRAELERQARARSQTGPVSGAEARRQTDVPDRLEAGDVGPSRPGGRNS